MSQDHLVPHRDQSATCASNRYSVRGTVAKAERQSNPFHFEFRATYSTPTAIPEETAR